MLSFLRRKILHPILQQLKQGTTPEGLALSFAVGATLALFPIFGTTTALCVLAGMAMGLNHPTVQAANYLMTPFHLFFIPFSIRTGEKILGLPAVAFDPREVAHSFTLDATATVHQYGASAASAILVWAMVAAVLAPGLYFALCPILRKRVKPGIDA